LYRKGLEAKDVGISDVSVGKGNDCYSGTSVNESLNISFSFYLHLIFQLDLNPAMPYTSQ